MPRWDGAVSIVVVEIRRGPGNVTWVIKSVCLGTGDPKVTCAKEGLKCNSTLRSYRINQIPLFHEILECACPALYSFYKISTLCLHMAWLYSTSHHSFFSHYTEICLKWHKNRMRSSRWGQPTNLKKHYCVEHFVVLQG